MSCAGFCSQSNLFLFSDVRNGIPKNGDCKAEIVNVLHKHASIYAGVTLGVGLIGLVGWSMSFAICFLTSKKFKGKDNYDYAKYGFSKEN